MVLFHSESNKLEAQNLSDLPITPNSTMSYTFYFSRFSRDVWRRSSDGGDATRAAVDDLDKAPVATISAFQADQIEAC
ncbi:hypothetical protein [Amycolatopsis magusensis]|uniref:hypothetical protein n=1 Tax=Amycolatopsis magusensis TaxID=882444 RepID=UPI00379B96D9